MTQITIDTTNLGKYLVIIGFTALIVIAAGLIMYDFGHDAGVASVPVAPVITASPTPAPTSAPAAVVVAAPVVPVVQVPVTDYIGDVQSVGTDYGYVCLVDGSGHEYLIMNFDPGTPELLHASYSGTVVNTYNGIPMLDDVALTGYPPYDYTSDHEWTQKSNYVQYNEYIRYNRYGQSVKCVGNLVCG